MRGIHVELITTPEAVKYMLAGLALEYRIQPNGNEASLCLKRAIFDVLEQLECYDIDISSPKSPFLTYAKLINYIQ